MGRDPVCFADVDEADATKEGLLSQQNGESFFFCSETCKTRFERDPGAFMSIKGFEPTDDEYPDNFIG